MDVTQTDAAGSATKPDAAGDKSTATGDQGQPEKMLPQSKVNDLVAREVGKVQRAAQAEAARVKELEEQLAKLSEKAKADEEAKLTEGQRAERQRATERAKLEGELKAERDRAASERTRRHDAWRASEAAKRVGSLAARLFHPDLVDDVTDRVASRLVVETDAKGHETLALRTGPAADDTEPLTEDTWKAFTEKHLARYFRGADGSGSLHGAGGSGGRRVDMSKLSALEKIELGLSTLK